MWALYKITCRPNRRTLITMQKHPARELLKNCPELQWELNHIKPEAFRIETLKMGTRLEIQQEYRRIVTPTWVQNDNTYNVEVPKGVKSTAPGYVHPNLGKRKSREELKRRTFTRWRNGVRATTLGLRHDEDAKAKMRAAHERRPLHECSVCGMGNLKQITWTAYHEDRCTYRRKRVDILL